VPTVVEGDSFKRLRDDVSIAELADIERGAGGDGDPRSDQVRDATESGKSVFGGYPPLTLGAKSSRGLNVCAGLDGG
jgi:hypothetical protein